MPVGPKVVSPPADLQWDIACQAADLLQEAIPHPIHLHRIPDIRQHKASMVCPGFAHRLITGGAHLHPEDVVSESIFRAWQEFGIYHRHDRGTMRFGKNAKVLAECMLEYYRISE